MTNRISSSIFRFAPSPNGKLHLGHAYSALVNDGLARHVGGRFLLRIEDIDRTRCTSELEKAIVEDLDWLGLNWEEPIRRQSAHFSDYSDALNILIAEQLVYPSFMTRSQIHDYICEHQSAASPWPRDPDGAPLYPGEERKMSSAERRHRISSGEPHAWRLDMQAAVRLLRGNLSWRETGSGPEGQQGAVAAQPSVWGDVVLARKDIPTSYHLAVTVDDAIQGVTNVVRGNDLFYATSVQRLLQELLGLAVPSYHHHQLILSEDGHKLSKSRGDTSLADLRVAGATPGDIRRMVGLNAENAPVPYP